MGRKIFITYKYGDTNVQRLARSGPETTKVRHYVDEIQDSLKAGDHINKGESDGESLAHFKDRTIESKLRNKIYDSSITVVFVSKGMKDAWLAERDQWMPWEISYSLKEHSRDGRISQTNAVLAVVLPDQYGNYDYFIRDNTCTACNCTTYETPFLFRIMGANMFNKKNPSPTNCASHTGGAMSYSGYHSYISSVKWTDFKSDIDKYLGVAYDIHSRMDEYNITKNLD